ncbi:MAG: glycosyltransferase [Actinomycetia bacterium]|nr:glycosyltransferase [Actinomycetes bacterium]
MSAPRRIVMIVSASGTADPRVSKEAEALVAGGYEVVVIAWDREKRDPALIERDGWRIESTGPAARHGAGLGNIGGYREFWRVARRRVAELRPDAIHCDNLDTVPAALPLVNRTSGSPRLVLDFWEMYRHSRALPQSGIKGVIARAAARYLERRSIPGAEVVITVGEGQVGYYRDLGARNIVLVENAPELERYTPVEREEPDFVVSFIGQKRWAPALVNLMKAIQPYPHLRALLVGGGPAEAEIARIAGTMERVEVGGRFDPSETPSLYHRCDAVFACYDASLENWRTAYPVKAMEAMACALPLICTRGTFSGDYVERHGLGYAVDDHDPGDIARALVALEDDRAGAREMGRRGRAIVEAGLNWTAASARLVAAYDAMFEANGVPLQSEGS